MARELKLNKLRFRLTDLPRPRWWGRIVRLFKTFEVLIFKILQVLDLYRPQKSILGIPSLATKSYTLIQAVVYNGTLSDVLGFRPRRLIYRLLKGLPDLELFERIRFEIKVSENASRVVEGSTETRGFIQLQLPWPMPWRAPDLAYLRMQPRGVETLVGRVKLGDYDITSSPVFFIHSRVKYILVSDIDDTIKDSNIAETTNLRSILRGIFRGHFYKYEAIAGMAEFYRMLASQGVMVMYLTSTPFQLAPFLLKFLRDNGFPEGPVFLRWLGYGRYGHKWRMLHRVLSNVDEQKFILVGDSGEQDLAIYRRLYENFSRLNKIEKILIRHVPGTPRYKILNDREAIYSNLDELREQLQFINPK